MTVSEQALKILPSGQRQLGRYTLLCHFATGGMANLYLAKFVGPDGFEKRVAIKQIHEHLNGQDEFIRMFVDEARLAARIAHPNVVQVIELGMAAQSHFIAMEYVDGESLAALLRRNRPSFSISARIGADAAAGLHAAHELRSADDQPLGVVHRDVSPQNILLSYDGVVKVVDFGVARARGRLQVTDAGIVKGKYSYMAPEQIANRHVDRRADVFSLGIVLYEMSTRHRLFKGDTEAATVAKVAAADVAPPSRLIPDYPPTLEAIVLKALQRDPEARFQTAEELQHALESFIIETRAPVLQGTLAKLMQEVFAERIKQKKQILSFSERLDAALPAVEIGSDPSLTLEGRVESIVREHSALQRKTQRRLAVFVGVSAAVLLLAVAVLVIVLMTRGTDTEGLKPRADAGATVVPVAGKKTIRITIVAQPPSTTISVDGKAHGNVYEVVREASSGSLKVALSAPDHVPQQFAVPLAEGGRWVIALQRVVAVRPDAGIAPPKITGKRKPGKRPRPQDDDDLLDNPYGE